MSNSELPPEVLLLVLSHIVLPSTFDSFSVRSKQLRSFCLVSSTWRGIFQSELFAHPVFTSSIKIEQYLSVASTITRDTSIKTLRIESNSNLGTTLFLKLIKFVRKGLRILYLSRVEDLSWSKLSLIRGLREMHLFECHFKEVSSNTISFPHLKSLSIIRNHYPLDDRPEDPNCLISPITAPSLRYLAVDSVFTNRNAMSNIDAFIPSLLNRMQDQIESIMLGYLRDSTVRWNEWKSLRLLDIDSTYYVYNRFHLEPINRLLLLFPSKIECLMIPYVSSTGFDLLSNKYQSLEKLHTIIYSTSSTGSVGVTRAQLSQIKDEAEELASQMKCRTIWDNGMKDDQRFFSSYWNAVTNLQKGNYKVKESNKVIRDFMYISL